MSSMCEEVNPATEHEADVYVRGACSHCPREMTRAVCREYAAFLAAVPGFTKCLACSGLTPTFVYFTVSGEVGK